MSRFVVPLDLMQVEWRGGFVQYGLVDSVNAALDGGDLDNQRRAEILDRIERSMHSNGGTLRGVDDLGAPTRQILGL